MPLLNVADWIDSTSVEGPGQRFALWVQGCIQRCPQCCNPHFLRLEPRHIIDSSAVIRLVVEAEARRSIEGITFLGGEPMLQARGLADVARASRDIGLSVMVFTGYSLEGLLSMALPGVPELLAATDVLVDGPYMKERRELVRNWVGSENQRFHYMTQRYDARIETDPAFSRGVEFRIGTGGSIKLNGWPIG